jgi:hypothetical protein
MPKPKYNEKLNALKYRSRAKVKKGEEEGRNFGHCTQAEREIRVSEMVVWMIEGNNRKQLVDLAKRSGWELTEGGMEHYMKEARKRIKAVKIDLGYEFKMAKERNEMILNKSLEQHTTFGVALAANKQNSELMQLVKSQQSNDTGNEIVQKIIDEAERLAMSVTKIADSAEDIAMSVTSIQEIPKDKINGISH